MEISTRALTSKDFEAVATLYRGTDRWMDRPVSSAFLEENLEIARAEYLFGKSKRKILLGTFLGNQLTISGGLYFWSDLPFCTINRVVSLRSEISPRIFLQMMLSLFTGFLDEIESRDVTRFYLLTTSHHLSALAQIGRIFPRLSRDYLMTVEEVVQARSKPQSDYVWKMMGEKVWPTTLVIRAGTAYNHVRKFDKLTVGDDVLKAWSHATS